MKSTLRRILTVGAAAATVAMAIPAAPAFAINKVGCGWAKTDFLEIYNNYRKDGHDKHCFANGGVLAVAIYGVDTINSGKNDVWIDYIDDAGKGTNAMKITRNRGWYLHQNGINGKIHMIYKITIL